MAIFDWVAAFVLFMEMPIPLYWFVIHPQPSIWRQNLRAGYLTGVLVAWGMGGTLLVLFHGSLFTHEMPSVWSLVLGIALILFDGFIFARARKDLGTSRLVGEAEMQGRVELERNGIYARIRHPRYAGMIAAVFGACLLVATPRLWIVFAGWLALTMLAIQLEEREMRRRFGAAFEDYCRKVARFLPLRFARRER